MLDLIITSYKLTLDVSSNSQDSKKGTKFKVKKKKKSLTVAKIFENNYIYFFINAKEGGKLSLK